MTENGPRGCVIHSLGLFCGIETGIGVCVVAFKLLAGPETDIEGGNCCKLCHSRCNCYYIGVAFKLITNITTPLTLTWAIITGNKLRQPRGEGASLDNNSTNIFPLLSIQQQRNSGGQA